MTSAAIIATASTAVCPESIANRKNSMFHRKVHWSAITLWPLENCNGAWQAGFLPPANFYCSWKVHLRSLLSACHFPITAVLWIGHIRQAWESQCVSELGVSKTVAPGLEWLRMNHKCIKLGKVVRNHSRNPKEPGLMLYQEEVQSQYESSGFNVMADWNIRNEEEINERAPQFKILWSVV